MKSGHKIFGKCADFYDFIRGILAEENMKILGFGLTKDRKLVLCHQINP